MPDHLHLLLTTDDLPNTMQHIRGGFSHRLASKLDVWQRGYTDHLIRTRDDFATRLAYIHQNPVRAHLVECAEEYPYSSAYRPAKTWNEREQTPENGVKPQFLPSS